MTNGPRSPIYGVHIFYSELRINNNDNNNSCSDIRYSINSNLTIKLMCISLNQIIKYLKWSYVFGQTHLWSAYFLFRAHVLVVCKTLSTEEIKTNSSHFSHFSIKLRMLQNDYY